MPIARQSTARDDLDDLDELATTYADAWSTATPARRGRLRDDLICRCLPFAGRMARRYAGRGEPLDDLQQVARVGLINAVDRYNPARGSFTAFAVITVCGELKRHFRDKTWALHVERQLRDLSVDVHHATVTLSQVLQREPTIEELALHLEVSAAQVRNARLCGIGYHPVPLSTPTGDDKSPELGDVIGFADPELEILADKVAAVDLMRLLPQRIQRILALRFYGNLTQAQIADDLDVSQMQVSRLLTQSLTWLRASMLSDAPPPPPWTLDHNPHRSTGMRIWHGRTEGVVRVRVSGGLDRDTTSQLRIGLHSAVVAAADVGGRLVIDVSGVPLTAVAALAVLRDTVRSAALADVEVILAGARPKVAAALVPAPLASAVRTRAKVGTAGKGHRNEPVRPAVHRGARALPGLASAAAPAT